MSGSPSSGLTPSIGLKLSVDIRLHRVVSHFWQGGLETEEIVLMDFVISDSQQSRKRNPFCFQIFHLQKHFLLCGPPIFVYILQSLNSKQQMRGA